MVGTLDPVLFTVGFLLGAGCLAALGMSFGSEYPRRIVLPATVVAALAGGLTVGWALNSFVHFAQRTGP